MTHPLSDSQNTPQSSLPTAAPSLVMTPWLGQAFMALIRDRTGLEIKPQEQASLCHNIVNRAQAFSPPFLEAYYEHLTEDTLESQQEWHVLSQFLTNGESFFFRDKGQFLALEKHILPELIERKSAEKKLRLCSAGCATGEEVYSLVILLHELIDDIEQWDVRVYGVDLNPASIAHAKAGIYRNWSFRGVDSDQRQTYFKQVTNRYHIDPKFKAQVAFYPLNLVSDPFVLSAKDIFDGVPIHDPLEDFDLIVCRNVFIYFSADAIAQVLGKFYQALRPLGYLLTGHAELHGQKLDLFQVKTFPESLLFQRPALPLPGLIPSPSSAAAAAAADVADMASSMSLNAGVSTVDAFQEAEILFKNKAFNPALHQAEKALKLNPGAPKVLSLLAKIHAALHHAERALHYCHEAIKADGCFLAPHYLLAKIFTAQGDLSAAKRTLKKIIYLEPNAVIAYLELSQLYQQEGNTKKSDLMRRCALDIFGQHLSASEAMPDSKPK
ncbi:MAG: CheR family methyltransferase [Cyanobacteria bacterium J06598_3]